MHRITPDTLFRLETMQDFFLTAPQGVGRPPRAIEPATVPVTHRWTHAYQNVDNGGGHSFLNLWRPGVGANQVPMRIAYYPVSIYQGGALASRATEIDFWPPPGGAMINANLTPSQSWPGCYTAEVDLYAAPWSETLWYGGPGGTC